MTSWLDHEIHDGVSRGLEVEPHLHSTKTDKDARADATRVKEAILTYPIILKKYFMSELDCVIHYR